MRSDCLVPDYCSLTLVVLCPGRPARLGRRPFKVEMAGQALHAIPSTDMQTMLPSWRSQPHPSNPSFQRSTSQYRS